MIVPFYFQVGSGERLPATPIVYESYGMRNRTEIADGVITVYHLKRGVEKQQMEIDIEEKSEEKIRQSITNRFCSSITYPFSNQLRFSLIVGQRFLFIRGSRLEIYSNCGYEEVPCISISDLKNVIMEYFGYDINSLVSLLGYKDSRANF